MTPMTVTAISPASWNSASLPANTATTPARMAGALRCSTIQPRSMACPSNHAEAPPMTAAERISHGICPRGVASTPDSERSSTNSSTATASSAPSGSLTMLSHLSSRAGRWDSRA